MSKFRAPTHPGGILKRLYLEPLGLTVVELAAALAVSRKAVSNLVNERARITPTMAMRLSIVLRTTPQLWLNLQQNHDLWRIQRSDRGLKGVRPLAA